MHHFIRVEGKDTGDQFDVALSAFDPEIHRKVSASSRWPDLVGDTARPRPALYRTKKGLVTADGDPVEELTAGSAATPTKES